MITAIGTTPYLYARQKMRQDALPQGESEGGAPALFDPKDAAKQKECGIRSKVSAGATLTWEEKSFLRNSNKDLYTAVQHINLEQRLHQRSLQLCNSREAQKFLSFHKTMSILSTANLKGQGISGPDSNNTLARINALRRVEQNPYINRFV